MKDKNAKQPVDKCPHGWPIQMACTACSGHPPMMRESVNRLKLAKWLHDFEAEVDSHGVHLRPWETQPLNIKEAYRSIADECIEVITQIEGGQS